MSNTLRTLINPAGRWLLIAGVVLAGTATGQTPLASAVSSKPPPPASPVIGSLTSVAALSSRYVWAVGGAYTERWNGRRWTAVPNPLAVGTQLSGVAATSARNAWAVGTSLHGAPVILRWDGIKWREVASPVRFGQLTGVAVSSMRNAWAVGYLITPGKGSCANCRTITLHWNGSRWSKVPSPEPGMLQGVAIASARSAWAVGTGPQGAMILRWTGARWVHVASHSAGDLTAVAALSASSAWAVGNRTGSLIERWNGRTWKQVRSATSRYLDLIGVSAESPTDIWAVGDQGGGIVTMHWNGKSWKIVKSPTVPYNAHGHGLNSVATISAKDAWAVGYYGGGGYGLFAHWNGTAWRRAAN